MTYNEIVRLKAELDTVKAERDRLAAENKWHPATERPSHCGPILIATSSGEVLRGLRVNLIESDHWRELPRFTEAELPVAKVTPAPGGEKGAGA